MLETDYGELIEEGDQDETELEEISQEEQSYLLSLLRRPNIPAEDAELVLTLMRDHSTDFMEFIPTLISEFPGLAKRLYYFCSEADNREIVAALSKASAHPGKNY